jgi:hypothetical protein
MAEAQRNAVPEWRITGDWFDLCNCAVGCPCVFGSDPTLGYCEGLLVWLIREGYFGNVKFGDALGVVLVDHFEGSVLEKNREFGFLIDERANADQRQALKTIFTGEAGGSFAAWRDLTIKVTGVAYVPITIGFDAETWTVEVPGTAKGEGGPFRKYMVPPGDTCRIYNAPRPEVGPGHITVGQSRFFEADAFGRRFQWQERSSKHIAFDLRGPGAFTWRKPMEGR